MCVSLLWYFGLWVSFRAGRSLGGVNNMGKEVKLGYQFHSLLFILLIFLCFQNNVSTREPMNLTQCRPEPSTVEPDPISQSTPLNTNDTDHMVLEVLYGRPGIADRWMCLQSDYISHYRWRYLYELNTGSIDVHEEPGPEPCDVGGKFLLVVLSIM